MPNAHEQHSHGPGRCLEKGRKKNPSSSPWQAPEDGLGALRLPPARGRLCAALHTPQPEQRHQGLLVLEGSSLYATPSARTLHTPALCMEAGHCHGPLLTPLEQRAQNTAHTHPHPASSPTRQAPSSLQLRALLRFLHKINTKVTAPAAAHVSLPPACRAVAGARGWGGPLSCSRSSPAGATAGPARGARTGSGAGWRPTRSSAGTRPSRRRAGGPGTPGTRSPPTCRTRGSAQWHRGVGKGPPCPGSAAPAEPQTRARSLHSAPGTLPQTPAQGMMAGWRGLQHLH